MKVPSSTHTAHSKSHVHVDSPVADVSLSKASDGVEKNADVEVVGAVLEDVQVESALILNRGAQPSTSVLENECVETFDWTASNEHVDDVKGGGVSSQNFSSSSYATTNIGPRLREITEEPWQPRTAKTENKCITERSIQVFGGTTLTASSRSLSKLTQRQI